MHLPTLLSLLLPLTTAFLLPPSLPNGLYLAPINSTSASSIQRVDLDALIASHSHPGPSTSRIDRRQEKLKYLIDRTHRMFPVHSDYNACTDSWRTFFAAGGVVKGHFVFLCTQGEAVLAGCNYRNNDFSAARYTNPTLVDFFNEVADRQWGTWTTGWVRFKYYDYSFVDFTFWRDVRGTGFCTDLP